MYMRIRTHNSNTQIQLALAGLAPKFKDTCACAYMYMCHTLHVCTHIISGNIIILNGPFAMIKMSNTVTHVKFGSRLLSAEY